MNMLQYIIRGFSIPSKSSKTLTSQGFQEIDKIIPIINYIKDRLLH
nr:MAG TPA: hypothetical protein [Caudoviricetes sp.]